MKIKSVISVCLLATALAWAQPPEGAPAGRGRGMFGGGSVASPEVAPDRTATFRLRAPNAEEVFVSGIGEDRRLDMTKDDQGVWSAVSEPMEPGVHEYTFSVDGLRINDPGNNRFKTSYQRVSSSLLIVPGSISSPAPGIERGAVATHYFHSDVAGDDREFRVYTPAGYDPAREEPYPVLFLLHGLGDEASSWTEMGMAHVILDNLIARGDAVPMVMVNTLGYGNDAGPGGAMRDGMLAAFAQQVIQEVLPRVEQRYNVSEDRTQRAIAGLSMGGAEATMTGLNNLDTFAWIGSFSGAYVMWPVETEAAEGAPAGGRGGRQIDATGIASVFPNLDAADNDQIELLWIACGDADGLVGVNRNFRDWLDSKGVEHTYTEIPDMGHVWPLWRQNLADLAPLLFK
jgi:enterochelin esterase family protein